MDSNGPDAETIRLKRIARLQALSNNNSNDTSGSSSTATTSPATSSHNEAQTVQSGPMEIDMPKNQAAQVHVPQKATVPIAQSQPQTISLKRPSSPAQPVPVQIRKTQADSAPVIALDDWEDRIISQVFQVTVQRNGSQGYLFLEDLSVEMQEQSKNLRLGLQDLDQIIISAASASSRPFHYLLQCFKRVVAVVRSQRPSRTDDTYKGNFLGEMRRICVDFTGNALVEPDIFETSERLDLASNLLKDFDHEDSLPMEMLHDFANSFEVNPQLQQMFSSAFEEMSRRLRTLELIDDYKIYTNALERIVSIKPMAVLLTSSPMFVPLDVPAHELEVSTLLGPYFRISPLQPRVVDSYFPSPKTQAASALNLASSSLRLTMRTHQDQLCIIVNSLVRASPESRNRLLDFLALVLNRNHKRRALHVQENTVSSDGFLLNITAILNRLCDPFMDATYTKVDKIDVRYFRQQPRVDIKEETKINADQAATDAYYQHIEPGKPNFNSEVFFLNVVAHHVGYIACINNLSNLSRHLSDMESNVQRLEQEREKYVNTPHITQIDNSLRMLKERIQKGYSYQAAMDGLLADEGSQLEALSFMNYLTVWILRILSPKKDYPQHPLKLPLPPTAPPEFSNLPEYLIEDAAAVFCHVVRSYPPRVTNQQSEGMMILAITLLRTSTYVKNPYLKAKLVEALFAGVLPMRAGVDRGVLGDLLSGHPFALENLLHSLMSFYIEVEQTGAHTQFYDKFNIRYNISQVVKSIWKNATYRDKLGLESRVNPDFFVRFVALLLNDVTYLLDESLSKLSEIHRLQIELDEPNVSTLDEQTRTERRRLLASDESQATTYVSLAKETVLMVKRFTAAIPDAFVSPELVNRVAGMLDFNLEALVGPKCSNLRVRDPKKYRFEPRSLLSEMVSIYLNLGTRPVFVQAIAADGRSYKPELFSRALGILTKYALMSPEELSAFQTLANATEEAKRLELLGEEELGEIPDEFLDPLLFTLMENPVILPSNNRVDISTIKSHLLSDPTDPFTRAPLKIEDVRPDTELQERIKAFIAGKRGL